MKKCSTKTIQSLPPEILLTIFQYLSPKDLAYCSLVSKQWYYLSSTDDIWRKLFRKYHINLPLNVGRSVKKEYLKRSEDFLREFLVNSIKRRRIHHLFPCFDETRKLELSIQGEMFDYKNNLLLKHGQRISVNNLNPTFNNAHPYINYQVKIDKKQFPDLKSIDSLSVQLLVPALINKLVPAKEAIRMHLKIFDLKLSKKIKLILSNECRCKLLLLSTIGDSKRSGILIDWHVCVDKCLIGIWSSDKSIAYFTFHISMLDIQSALERSLCNNSIKKLSFPVIIKTEDQSESRFVLSKSENDLKCMLSIENIEPSKSLLVNCWRSVDYFKGFPIYLIEKSDSASHLKFKDNIEFKPAIGHLHMKYDNMLKFQIDIVTSINDLLWSHVSCVTLNSISINNVNYEYAKTELVFDNSIIKGTFINTEFGDFSLTELTIL